VRLTFAVNVLDSSRQSDVQITGDPTSGGHVKGRFAGAPYKFSEKDDYYGWNLSFDLPVH
jgi:hypothetical protein